MNNDFTDRDSLLWQSDDFVCYVRSHDDAKLPVSVDGATETVSAGDAYVVVVRGRLSGTIYKSTVLGPRGTALPSAITLSETWRQEFADRWDDSRPIWQRDLPPIARTCPDCGAAMKHERTSRADKDPFQLEENVCPSGHRHTFRQDDERPIR